MEDNAMIRGAGGGAGEQPRTPVESPDTLRSIAYARILDLVSEGEIYGFADQENPLSCIFLNQTPIANADGSLNFKNVQVDSRVGTQDQDYIKGFPGVESETGIGIELRQETSWTQAFTNLDLSGVRIRLSTPAMTRTNTSNGDIGGSSVVYKFELSTDGGPFEQVFAGAMTGKTTTKYERSHRIDLPLANTGWTVRTTRMTADSISSALQNATYIEAFTEIIDVKLRYPMSAYVSLVVDAEQFSQIPSRAYRLKGRIIRVPTNYDPVLRTYTGVWDGTFMPAYSNNPAWVFYDMATNRRYGLGKLVATELIDKWSLYRIAMYCDQLVDDGYGGQEPRFTANVYFQKRQEAYRLMLDLATIFRGIMYAAGGTLSAVADMPEDPVYLYNQANVVDGKFTYSGTGRKVRHTVALVSWNDLNDFGRAKIEYVKDDEGIARYGVQPSEVIALGATSRGQALRMGRHILITERVETDSVAFTVGLDGTVAAPGKIVLISDPLRAGRRTGGRLRDATLASITVDQMPYAEIGDRVTCVLPTGFPQQRVIESIVDNTITFTVPFDSVPVRQSVWLIESDELVAQTFRIIGVTDNDDSTGYTISAIKHVAGKFASIDTGIKLELPPITTLPSAVVPAPTGLVATWKDVTDDNTTRKVATVSWNAVSVAVLYDIQWRQNNGTWVNLPDVAGLSVDLYDMPPGPFEVQCVAINTAGVRSQATFAGPFEINVVTTPPGFVDVLIGVDEELQLQIVQEAADRIAAIAAEGAARAEAILNEQLVREAAIETEQIARQSMDESLAVSISTLAAGTGEQFDSKRVWYFDTDLESWTGNGAPTVADGFLRPANSADPWIKSPVAIAVNGDSYKYVKLRINRTGAPLWYGRVQGFNASSVMIGELFIVEPEFQADGDATIDFKDIPWAGTIDSFRLKLTAAQTATDYMRIDWIAIGRPAPGASVAALQEEQIARITADATEVAQRTTLAAQIRGDYNGTNPAALVSGLIYNERQLRITAESAIASDVTALGVRIDDAETGISLNSSAIGGLEASVETINDELVAQASDITLLESEMGDKASVSALTALTVRTATVEGRGGNDNMLPNSTMSLGDKLYAFDKPGAGAKPWADPVINLGGSSLTPTNMRSWGISNAFNAVPASELVNMFSPTVPVTQGQVYIGTWFVALERAEAQLYIEWKDASGTVLGYVVGELRNIGAGSDGGTNISNWYRLIASGTAPTNARLARMVIQIRGNGNNTPNARVLRPMLEWKTNPLQVGASPYNTGGVESFASYTMTLDVNGYITGWNFLNDGSTGTFTIRADKFSIVSPTGSGERTEYSANNWRVYDAAGVLRVQLGVF
jgi:predicted phage tail protein